jgi:Tfp pilus assembly protein PilX
MRSLSHKPTIASSLKRSSQAGISLLETLIALTVLVIVTVGVMSVALVAVETTENQGHLQSRAAEYAQDKMEQLISLGYGDGDAPATSGTDTTVFPACSLQTNPSCTTGTGLAIGGSSDPANPVATPGNGYVDYLDSTGNPTTSTGSWYYIRVWKIEQAATNLKRITVTAQVRSTVGGAGSGAGAVPTATVVSLKTAPF